METNVWIAGLVGLALGFLFGVFMLLFYPSDAKEIKEDSYPLLDDIDYSDPNQVKFLEYTTDKNMEIVSRFMDHFKSETEMEIPDYVFLSFFNA